MHVNAYFLIEKVSLYYQIAVYYRFEDENRCVLYIEFNDDCRLICMPRCVYEVKIYDIHCVYTTDIHCVYAIDMYSMFECFYAKLL